MSIVYLVAGTDFVSTCMYGHVFVCAGASLCARAYACQHVYLSVELCYCPEPVAVRTSDLPSEKLVADWQYTQAM